jgi:hypothetical protein
MPIWRRLLPHWIDFAELRAAVRAGRRIAMSNAMIEMTTNNSIRVNPPRLQQGAEARNDGPAGKNRYRAIETMVQNLLIKKQRGTLLTRRENTQVKPLLG